MGPRREAAWGQPGQLAHLTLFTLKQTFLEGSLRASLHSEAGEGTSAQQVIPESLTRTGPACSRGSHPVLTAVEQPPQAQWLRTNTYTPCSWLLGSGVWTGPEGDAMSLPRDVQGLGQWPWRLGVLPQKAWLCRVSWASVGARCDRLLTEHLHVALPLAAKDRGVLIQ